MKNKKSKKLVTILLGMIFVLSSSLLSFELIIVEHYNTFNIILTCIVSLICAFIYYKKTYNSSYNRMKKEKLLLLLSILFSFIITRKLYITKAIDLQPLFDDKLINPFKLYIFILSSFSLIYILFNLLYMIRNWYKNFYNSLNKWEKKAYLITSAISFIVIVILYSTNMQWFLQYDKVYSMDSGFVFDSVLQSSTYYRIRHPLFNIFTFPIFAIIAAFSKLVAVGDLYTIIIGILFQFINSQLLIFIGIFLEKLTSKKIVYIVYMLSFPTITYLLFLEKYQICVFFLVLYVYTICTKKEKSTPSLIASIGTMPTSIYIGLCELMVKDSFKAKLKKVLSIIIIGILSLICLGRAHLLFDFFSELQSVDAKYFSNNLGLYQRIICLFKMFESCLIALPSYVNDYYGIYTWFNLYQNFSLISIVIFVILIIGAYANRKELFTKINILWLSFSFILFIIIKWSCHESPLFSIYFSWAIIPLFINGIDYIIKKLKLNQKCIYFFMIIFICFINFITILDIYKFISIL